MGIRSLHRFASRLLLVAFLLPVLGWAQSHECTVDKPRLAGLGVFGSGLGLHGSDTLMVQGDVVLDHAHIVGEGVLSMQEKRPRRLVSRQSRLAHLHIRVEKGVTLQGDLRVEKSLTIETGTLDARTATLTLGDQVQLRLLPHGKLLHPAISTRLSRQSGTTYRPPDHLSVWAMLEPNTLGWAKMIYEKRSAGELEMTLLRLPADEPTPPPEPRGTSDLW